MSEIMVSPVYYRGNNPDRNGLDERDRLSKLLGSTEGVADLGTFEEDDVVEHLAGRAPYRRMLIAADTAKTRLVLFGGYEFRPGCQTLPFRLFDFS
jgi:hypothetical protein